MMYDILSSASQMANFQTGNVVLPDWPDWPDCGPDRAKNSQTGPDWPDSGQTPAQTGQTGQTDPQNWPDWPDWPDWAGCVELQGSLMSSQSTPTQCRPALTRA